MAKIKLNLLILGIFLLITLSSAFAEIQPSQNYNKILLSPFYRASMTSGVNYDYTFSINPPDKMQSIESALVTIDVWMTPTVTYTLLVNGQSCNNPTYIISTTYSGAGKGVLTFDCKNIINKAGTYTVRLSANKNSGASTGWVDITYTNNPKGKIDVFGTEYYIGQEAKLWLQLLNSTGGYVDNGVCYADIYTPNNTEYIEHAQMSQMNHDGIYYYDLSVPSNAGVYPAIARCFYKAIENEYYPSAYSMKTGDAIDTTWSKSYVIDGDFIRFNENNNGSGIRRLDFTLDITGMTSCTNVSEDLLTSINIFSYAKFDSDANDNIIFYIRNWSNSKWIPLSNIHLEGNVWRTTSNTIFTNNITKDGFYNSTIGGMRLKIVDSPVSDGGDSNLDLDKLYIGCNQLALPEWQEIKGSSELHVTDPFTVVQTINSTAIAEEVWSWEGFISDNILTNFANKVWTWIARYTHGESNQ